LEGTVVKLTDESLADDPLFRIWVTRGCYFILADRLKRKSRYSNGSITILSFYVIVISIIDIAFGSALPANFDAFIPPITVILSVFIIIITLLEQSKEYRLEAEYSEQTAHKLEDLFGRFEAFRLGVATGDEAAFRTEYSNVLISARTTRRTIDYIWFQLTNASDLKLRAPKVLLLSASLAWTGALEYWIYAAMVLLPPIGGMLLII
jgi:hypothetical protein